MSSEENMGRFTWDLPCMHALASALREQRKVVYLAHLRIHRDCLSGKRRRAVSRAQRGSPCCCRLTVMHAVQEDRCARWAGTNRMGIESLPKSCPLRVCCTMPRCQAKRRIAVDLSLHARWSKCGSRKLIFNQKLSTSRGFRWPPHAVPYP